MKEKRGEEMYEHDNDKEKIRYEKRRDVST